LDGLKLNARKVLFFLRFKDIKDTVLEKKKDFIKFIIIRLWVINFEISIHFQMKF
jgi:hypothetical protein